MIYGIFSGEYSDWDCHGYFETQEEAAAYVEKMNAKRGEYGYRYYIKILYNLSEGGDKDKKKAYVYYPETGAFERMHYWDDELLISDSPMLNGLRALAPFVVVFVKDEDAHKVPKIAQDAIAKARAERAGL